MFGNCKGMEKIGQLKAPVALFFNGQGMSRQSVVHTPENHHHPSGPAIDALRIVTGPESFTPRKKPPFSLRDGFRAPLQRDSEKQS